jgi:hypothetical protein
MKSRARATVFVVALNATAVSTVADGSTRITMSEAREIAFEALTAAEKKLPSIGLEVETKNPETATCVVFEAIFDNPGGSVHVDFFTVDMRTGEVWGGPNPPCERVSSRSLAALQSEIRARHHIPEEDARRSRRDKPCCADR